ncbi:MAG: hypothetical protein C0392_01985 [Syntrophus sp. (in: bacteria)]|nr:hypothetical protein [Syntrophus sp. (in: bacteria)]
MQNTTNEKSSVGITIFIFALYYTIFLVTVGLAAKMFGIKPGNWVNNGSLFIACIFSGKKFVKDSRRLYTKSEKSQIMIIALLVTVVVNYLVMNIFLGIDNLIKTLLSLGFSSIFNFIIIFLVFSYLIPKMSRKILSETHPEE